MPKAVGIVRVSRTKGEGIVSPIEQRERIEAACARDGLTLIGVFEELDVSGGAALERRPGLARALTMIEAGEAQTLVVAYFDRLVRSLAVQAELVARVEAAGGGILAVDVGAVTNGSSAQWLSASVLGVVAEYQRRSTAERTQEAKVRAIARGVPTWPTIPPGYRRKDDGTLAVDQRAAKVVREAFTRRADGASIEAVRDYMRSKGIARSYTGTQTMLASRVYLGELHFGELENIDAHPPLIDRETFARVQALSLPRGRKAKSEHLLARLGILRCGTCGARMVIGSVTRPNARYPNYRCPPNNDCPRRVIIAAAYAENAVIEAVKEMLADVHESASLDDGIAEAQRELERAEQELEAAVAAFAGLDDVQAANERLRALREAREAARRRIADLSAATAPSVTVAAGDWDKLTLDEQRALIRALIARATVAPGRGPDRVSVEPL